MSCGNRRGLEPFYPVLRVKNETLYARVDCSPSFLICNGKRVSESDCAIRILETPDWPPRLAHRMKERAIRLSPKWPKQCVNARRPLACPTAPPPLDFFRARAIMWPLLFDKTGMVEARRSRVSPQTARTRPQGERERRRRARRFPTARAWGAGKHPAHCHRRSDGVGGALS